MDEMVSFSYVYFITIKKKKFRSLNKAPERQLCCLPLILARISGKDPWRKQSDLGWRNLKVEGSGDVSTSLCWMEVKKGLRRVSSAAPEFHKGGHSSHEWSDRTGTRRWFSRLPRQCWLLGDASCHGSSCGISAVFSLILPACNVS